MFLPAKVSTETNRRNVGKPTTLSFFSVLSQFQNYLGQKMARLACVPQRSFDTLAGSNHENKAGRFYFPAIKNKSPLTSAANTGQRLTTNERVAFTMANQDFNLPLDDGQDFTHLSEADLSALLDLLTSQVEYHRDELARLKPLLHRLQGQIPNNPIFDFISTLD